MEYIKNDGMMAHNIPLPNFLFIGKIGL